MVSEGMERVIRRLRKFKESIDGKQSVEAIRDGLEQMASRVVLPEDVKCEIVDAGGVPAEWISTPDAAENHVVLYLHGGGWISGSINTHRDLVARISRTSKSRILILNYHLAPEFPFPAAFDDCISAYKWLLSNGIKPEDIVIAGDSAGATLTITCLIRLRDEGIELPSAAVSISPLTDATFSGESFKTKAKLDPFYTPEDCEFMVSQYIGDMDRRKPLISPLYADLHGLPPLLIHVGTLELLLDDSVRFAECAKEAGVDVTLEVFKDMPHVFHAFAGVAPEGQDAIEKIGIFIQDHIKKIR